MKETENAVSKKFTVQGKSKLFQASITMPQGSGLRLILVPASESGKPDSDLYNVLDKKWRSAKVEAKGWYQSRVNYKLGAVKEVCTQSDVWLMNMLILDKDNVLNEEALKTALKEVAKVALYERASVHCSTLLTTAYPQLQDMLTTSLIEKGVSVFFYQEPDPTK